MPRRVIPLTDAKVKNAKPGANLRKLADGGGMYLMVTPSGGKCWRMKYHIAGREKLLALGTYPEVSLAEAREKRDVARKQLAKGIDPGEAKKAAKAAKSEGSANSFEIVAREWHGKFSTRLSPAHAAAKMRRLEVDVFPTLGGHSIGDIKAPGVYPGGTI